MTADSLLDFAVSGDKNAAGGAAECLSRVILATWYCGGVVIYVFLFGHVVLWGARLDAVGYLEGLQGFSGAQ